jgi:hypothetical protein
MQFMARIQSDKMHVIKRDSGWAVKKEGSVRATKVYGTKAEAVRHASRTAKSGGQLIIHNNDGSIEEWISFKAK